MSAAPETDSRPRLTRQDSKGGGVDSRFCCNICLEAVVEPVATLCGHLYCWPCLFRWLEPGMYPGERASLGVIQQSLASDANRRVCPVCKAPCSVPTLVPIYIRESNESEDSFLLSNKATTTSLENESENDNQDREAVESDGDENIDITRELDGSQAAGITTFASDSLDPGLSEDITGLRQRIRFRSRDSENSGDTVPSRPIANSPRHQSPTSPSSTPPTPQRYRTNSWVAPLTPTGHRGSLTHGLLLSLQQATAGSSGVPPLHRRDGVHPADWDAESSASAYLSRLLLMLGCFVILCLLLL